MTSRTPQHSSPKAVTFQKKICYLPRVRYTCIHTVSNLELSVERFDDGRKNGTVRKGPCSFCVCVCVCVGGGEKERESKEDSHDPHMCTMLEYSSTTVVVILYPVT